MDAALARATMPVLLLASPGDRLIGAGGLATLRASLPHANLRGDSDPAWPPRDRRLPGTPEGDFIARAIRGFLAAPQRVSRGAAFP